MIDLRDIHYEKNRLLKEIKLRLSRTEDQMMMKCSSSNLVKCYEVFANMDLKIIVMEYCNKGTLENYIKKKENIPER